MNKSTRTLRKNIRAAGKKGEAFYSRMQPVGNYHDFSNDQFRSNPSLMLHRQEFPTATMDKRGVITQNNERNMCQRVFLNTGEGAKTQSLTVHEPANKGEPVVHKNHGYVRNYRQPNLQS